MKKLLSLIILLPFLVFTQSDLQYENWTNDFADVLTESQEISMNEKISEFEKKTDIEITIVTVNSLEDRDIESFTNDLYNRWGVGKSDKDNGLMLLIAPNERKWRTEVGYGLEEYLTDGYTRVEAENILPKYFREGDYYGGINKLLDNFIERLGDKTWIERQAEIEAFKIKKQESEELVILVFKWIGASILFIISLITSIFLYIKNIRRKKEIKNNISKIYNDIKNSIDNYSNLIKRIEILNDDTSDYKKSLSSVNIIYDDININKIKSSKKGVSNIESEYHKINNILDAPTSKMNKIINKYKDYDNIKLFIKGGSLSIMISKIVTDLRRFKVYNEKGEYKINWTDMNIISNLDFAKKNFQNMEDNLNIKNIQSLRKNYNECISLLDKSREIITNYESKLNNYYSAKKNIENHVNTLDVLVSEMDKKVKRSDVSSSTRRRANDIKIKINNYKPSFKQDEVVISYNILTNILSEIKSIISKSNSDIDDAMRYSSYSSSSSSSYGSSYGSSSYSSGSSSFGGFGGGRSGGGGSSGGW